MIDNFRRLEKNEPSAKTTFRFHYDCFLHGEWLNSRHYLVVLTKQRLFTQMALCKYSGRTFIIRLDHRLFGGSSIETLERVGDDQSVSRWVRLLQSKFESTNAKQTLQRESTRYTQPALSALNNVEQCTVRICNEFKQIRCALFKHNV